MGFLTSGLTRILDAIFNAVYASAASVISLRTKGRPIIGYANEANVQARGRLLSFCCAATRSASVTFLVYAVRGLLRGPKRREKGCIRAKGGEDDSGYGSEDITRYGLYVISRHAIYVFIASRFRSYILASFRIWFLVAVSSSGSEKAESLSL